MFLAGDSNGNETCVNVTGVSDGDSEGDEVLSVRVVGASGIAPGGFSATVTITVIDDDSE